MSNTRLNREQLRLVARIFAPLTVVEAATDYTEPEGSWHITLENMDGDLERFTGNKRPGAITETGIWMSIRQQINQSYQALRLMPIVREFPADMRHRIRLGLLQPGEYQYLDGDMRLLAEADVARVQPTTRGTYAILDPLGIWNTLTELCKI